MFKRLGQYSSDSGVRQVTTLSIELVRAKLMEADEVKKATVAKMKKADSGTKEIKNPTAGLGRSERHDSITQVVQDGGFTADVTPGRKDLSDDIVPQADFADSYTKEMPHGKTGGMGSNGENQKSPKGVGTEGMTPNQTTKLRQIPGGHVQQGIKHTEDDGNQKVFTIPQAKFADEYTQEMEHGRAGGTTDEDKGSAEPAKRSYGKMDGGPTRAGGKRTAKLGNDAVGAVDKDKQRADQVSGNQGIAKDPSDAPAKPTWKTDAKGTNIRESRVESGVAVSLNGKQKAHFEVVSHTVLNSMVESYGHHGYTLEFTRTEPAWKSDRQFLRALRESIHARFNHAPTIARQARKIAMQRFGELCRESFKAGEMYEDRHTFTQTMGTAFKKIERMAEDKYVSGLEYFDCKARVAEGDEVHDIEIVTQATDKGMACRQIRNRLHEDYGFAVDIQHIFVDGEKFAADKIEEFAPANLKKK